jgi:hypothetical protein
MRVKIPTKVMDAQHNKWSKRSTQISVVVVNGHSKWLKNAEAENHILPHSK